MECPGPAQQIADPTYILHPKRSVQPQFRPNQGDVFQGCIGPGCNHTGRIAEHDFKQQKDEHGDAKQGRGASPIKRLRMYWNMESNLSGGVTGGEEAASFPAKEGMTV